MERPRSGTEGTSCCRRAHRPQRADHTTSRIGHNTAPNRFSRLLRTADLSRNRRLIPRGTGSSNSAPSSGRHVAELVCVVVSSVTHMGWQFPGSHGPGLPIWPHQRGEPEGSKADT
jgi:hypothetical protein